MKCIGRWFAAALPIALGMVTVTSAQTIAADFSLTDRESRQQYQLSDLAGFVVVLDFFAYWCGPCRSSSPILEQEVAEYFHDLKGNVNGIPVRVIPINIQANADALTDAFVDELGLSHVADDQAGPIWHGAWDQFGLGYIPHFVVINGVADSSQYQQWEVLYSDYGFPGPALFRNLINTVDGTPAKVVYPHRIAQLPDPGNEAITLGLPESRTDEKYYLECDAGDDNWQIANPGGSVGTGGPLPLVDSSDLPGTRLRRYRVRILAL